MQTVSTKINVSPPKTLHKSPIRIWKFGIEFQVRNTFQKDRSAFGKWMKDEMILLGPAFIKIGQFMSTRVDVFGKEVIAELSKLQDNIYPIDFQDMYHVLSEELSDKLQDIEYIDPVPIATASIGQVHRGVLKTKEEIVLKVQKPYIADEIRTDIRILYDMNSFFAKFGNSQASDTAMILEQYEKFLSNELNYAKELHHMVKFRKLMEDLPIYIPKPYKDFSTKKVLTMEYVPSTKITDIDTLGKHMIDTNDVAQQLVELFLSQIVNYGIVHCDPHPGNLGVKPDGTIVLYDFGNVVNLSSDFRKNVNNLVFTIYQRDIDEFVDILIRLNIVQLEDDLDMLELKAFFIYFFDYLETLDFEKLKASILNRDAFVSSNVRVKINPDFLSLFRVFSLIDGTCLRLNPKFNYITALTPFSEELFTDITFIDSKIRRDIQKLSSYPKLLKNTDQNIIRLNRRITKMMDNTLAFRFMFILIAVIDNLHDPEKLMVIIPTLVYIFLRLEQQ